eukprot:9395158-Pyramimonas_sp.AAC.1
MPSPLTRLALAHSQPDGVGEPRGQVCGERDDGADANEPARGAPGHPLHRGGHAPRATPRAGGLPGGTQTHNCMYIQTSNRHRGGSTYWLTVLADCTAGVGDHDAARDAGFAGLHQDGVRGGVHSSARGGI